MGKQAWKRLTWVPMFFVLLLCLAGCAGGPQAITPFVLPSPIPDPQPLVQSTPQGSAASLTPPCTNSLLFLQDLTIPDNTVVEAGSSLDKQWQVQNNGTCNWDGRYRLRLISGDALGAPPEQALYPARSGSQVVLRMTFTAPSAPGSYLSEWQAYDPEGSAFGDAFFMKIVINP